MGKKPSAGRYRKMWVAAEKLPRSPGHPFYERLNQVLEKAGFDAFVERWCARFYADGIGRPLELAEVFVEPKHFLGTLYRAGNWRDVGRSRGFSRSNGRYTEPHGRLKRMYVYPLRRGARRWLRSPEPCTSWEPARTDPVSPEALVLPSLL